MSCRIRGQVSRHGSPLGRGVQLRTNFSSEFSYPDYGFRGIPQANAGISRHLKTVCNFNFNSHNWRIVAARCWKFLRRWS